MKKTLFVLVLLMLVTVFPAAASAADTVPNNLLISLWPEYNSDQVFFMQQAILSADAPLPATVRLSFPTGVQLRWAGEIMGSDVSKDIQADPTVTHKDGYDEVLMTLTKSRTAQIEAIWDGLKKDGKNRSISLDWIQRYEAGTTTFELLQPTQSSNVAMTPQSTGNRQSPEGFTYYQTAPKNIPVGQAVTFGITYTRNIDTPSVSDSEAVKKPAAAQDPFSYWMLALVFVVAGIGIIIYIFRETAKNKGAVAEGGKKASTSGKTGKSPASTKSASPSIKSPAIVIIVICVVLGGFALYSFLNTSKAPLGNNCDESVTYLQKGVDEYKGAWGVFPTDLKQLMESKDGKGPFVETISLKCPSDGTYYKIENGKIVPSESTEQP